jgi:hypothetical protein
MTIVSRAYSRPKDVPIGWGDDNWQFVEFVERIVVSYGLPDIFPGSGEAVLVQNDNP